MPRSFSRAKCAALAFARCSRMASASAMHCFAAVTLPAGKAALAAALPTAASAQALPSSTT
eukprot:4744345-Lingulodinium_polyedra.AAC.1